MSTGKILAVIAGLSVISAVTISLWPHGDVSGGICGTTQLSLKGPMPNEQELVRNISQSSTGLMTQASFAQLPPTLSATLCGSQRFQFTYSPNITEVQISVAGEMLYEGPPIAALDASKKPKGKIQVQFKWVGNDAQISIANG